MEDAELVYRTLERSLLEHWRDHVIITLYCMPSTFNFVAMEYHMNSLLTFTTRISHHLYACGMSCEVRGPREWTNRSDGSLRRLEHEMDCDVYYSCCQQARVIFFYFS